MTIRPPPLPPPSPNHPRLVAARPLIYHQKGGQWRLLIALAHFALMLVLVVTIGSVVLHLKSCLISEEMKQIQRDATFSNMFLRFC